MKINKIKLFAFVIVLFGVTTFASAQKSYTLDPKSTFSVAGTSTLHDWVDMQTKTGEKVKLHFYN